MKRLAFFALALGMLAPLPVSAQTPTPAPAKAKAKRGGQEATPFVEEQAKLETHIQGQLKELLERAAGSDKFSSVFVKVQLEPAPREDRSLSDFVGDEANVSLSYAPYSWSATDENDLSAKFLIKSVDVDLTYDASMSAEAQARLTDLVKRSLAAYPAKVQTQSVASFKEDKAQELKRPLSEKLAPWMPLLAAATLFMALVFLGVAFGVGLAKVADSMRSIAAQISTTINTRDNAKKDIDAQAKKLGVPEKPQLSLGLRYFDKNQRIFREYLNQKPLTLMNALTQESDENLAKLRALGPYLSEEEKLKLRELLGERTPAISKLASSEISPVAAFDWLAAFIDTLSGMDMVGGSKLLAKLPVEDLVTLMALKPQDYERLGSDQELKDEKSWRILTELMPPQTLAKLLQELPPAQWAPIVGGVEFNDAEAPELAKGIVHRLQEIKAVNDMTGGEGSTQGMSEERIAFIEEKILPAMIGAQDAFPLHEELERWNEVYSKQDYLRPLVERRYWTFDKLSLVPMPTLKEWVGGLESEMVGNLMYLCGRSNLASLKDALVSVLPEGMKKSIALSQLAKLEGGMEISAEELNAWSAVVRARLEGLRMQYKEGKFKLLSANEEAEGLLKAA